MTIEHGAEKIPGLILKINHTGLMVEMDKIPFPVGTYVMAHINFAEGAIVPEKVRSIKHYDKFFRKGTGAAGEGAEASATPKRLCEFHFAKISEVCRSQITQTLLLNQEKIRSINKDRLKKPR